jgi:hypothetical protein
MGAESGLAATSAQVRRGQIPHPDSDYGPSETDAVANITRTKKLLIPMRANPVFFELARRAEAKTKSFCDFTRLPVRYELWP